jgi:hypothetical protein
MAHDTMKTRRKLLPGQPGTKQLVKLYGDRLVCVRYRYDCEQQRRIKTVELITILQTVSCSNCPIVNKVLIVRI